MTPTPELREEVKRRIADQLAMIEPDTRIGELTLAEQAYLADAAIAATLAWVEREKK